MANVEFKQHAGFDQMFIYYRIGNIKKHVGFCGNKPGMPINFLIPKQCPLKHEQKCEVVAAVKEKLGRIKVTKQIEPYLNDGGSNEGSEPESDTGSERLRSESS